VARLEYGYARSVGFVATNLNLQVWQGEGKERSCVDLASGFEVDLVSEE
jgi:hypothetical protein